MNQDIKRLTDGANLVNKSIAYVVAYLSLGMMLSVTYLVIKRELFNGSSLMLQDGVDYMHAILFMLGVAYTLQVDEHVRVDIFYNKMNEQKKAIVNCIGTLLFLIPLCIFMIYINFPYVSSAWKIKEASASAGGIPFVYLLKSVMLIMPILLLIQAVIQLTNYVNTIINHTQKEA